MEIYGENQEAWFGCYDGHTFKTLRGDIINGSVLEPYETLDCPYVENGIRCTRRARILNSEPMTMAEFLAELAAIERNPYRWEEDMRSTGDRTVREFCRLAREHWRAALREKTRTTHQI